MNLGKRFILTPAVRTEFLQFHVTYIVDEEGKERMTRSDQVSTKKIHRPKLRTQALVKKNSEKEKQRTELKGGETSSRAWKRSRYSTLSLPQVHERVLLSSFDSDHFEVRDFPGSH